MVYGFARRGAQGAVERALGHANDPFELEGIPVAAVFSIIPIRNPYICRKSASFSIVRKHQGAMEIESEPGKGTVVDIRLPVDLPEDGA